MKTIILFVVAATLCPSLLFAQQDSGCALCGNVTTNGECQGTVLVLCNNGCLERRECLNSGHSVSCANISTGGMFYYECVAGLGQPCEPNYWTCDPQTTCNGHFPCDMSSGLQCVSEVCISLLDAGPADIFPELFDPDGSTAPRDARPDHWATDLRSSDTWPDAASTPDTATTPDTRPDHWSSDRIPVDTSPSWPDAVTTGDSSRRDSATTADQTSTLADVRQASLVRIAGAGCACSQKASQPWNSCLALITLACVAGWRRRKN